MSITLTNKIVQIRKSHICFSCLRKFEIGSKMRYWSGICEGDFGSSYCCIICDTIIDLLDIEEDYYPEGYIDEMLNKDETPEQFLDNLKKNKMWSIDKIKDLGFELISNDKLWCHFRGHGFDVMINLDTNKGERLGNYFNFHGWKNSFKGNFRAVLNNEEEFKFLLKVIQ